MKKNEEKRLSTADVPQTTQRLLLGAEGGTITPYTETTNGVEVGGGRSGRGYCHIAPDKVFHALPNAESDDYRSGNGGRRRIDKKYGELIDIICFSSRTPGVTKTEKAILERLCVGDCRPSYFPLITKISNRLGYVRRRNRLHGNQFGSA